MTENRFKIGCVIAYNDNHNNYGTSLQGYATIKKIQDLGYKCEIIRYKKQLSNIEKVILIIQMFRCGGTFDKLRNLKERLNFILHKRYKNNINIRTKAVNRYKTQKLEPLFKYYHGYEALCNGSQNYDAVLVGSDQVWTPMSLYNKYYNLLFVDERIPKVAYASSFGVSEIPKIQRKETGVYLNRFSSIGVRELKGKEIVDSLSTKKAKVVVDPTLLLTKQDWEKEIENSKINDDKPYIFCYLLGTNQEARDAISKLKAKTGLKIIVIRHLDEYVSKDEKFGDEAPYDVSPNDFVKYISRAQYVCTDSFHCTIFSILFHRQFITFYRFAENSKNSRNSRIDSLFSLLGLSDRLYKNEIYDTINNGINYDEVDRKLNELRIDSVNFLKSSLEYTQKQ